MRVVGFVILAWLACGSAIARPQQQNYYHYENWQYRSWPTESRQRVVLPRKAVRYAKIKKPRQRPPKRLLVASLSPKAVIDVTPTYDWSWVAIPRIGLPVEAPKPLIDPVEEYLCSVYDRMPIKEDGSGDFTWKDKEAARRVGLDVCQYAIGGMHKSLKRALYEIGKKADDQNIPWSFLSGYRGEYRQRIAAGFKAGSCGSMHSDRKCKEQGYGQGKAADLWTYDSDGKPAKSANPLFALIDKLGASFGITRPMKGGDPAHVQLFRIFDGEVKRHEPKNNKRYSGHYRKKLKSTNSGKYAKSK